MSAGVRQPGHPQQPRGRQLGARAQAPGAASCALPVIALACSWLAGACGAEEQPPTWTCAADLTLAPLALHADYCLAFRVRSPEAIVAAYSPLPDGRLAALELVEGSSWDAQVVTYELGDSSLIGRRVLHGLHVEQGADMIFANAYLAVGPDEQLAVGYTRASDFFGEVFWLRPGLAPLALPAPGHWDADFLADGTLLVSGFGLGATALGANGLYARRPEGSGPGRLVVEHLGPASGPVAVHGELVVAGGYTTTNRLFAFSASELAARLASSTAGPLDARTDGDLVYAGGLSDLALTDWGAVLSTVDDSVPWPYPWTGLRRYGLGVQGEAVAVAAPTTLVEASTAAQLTALAGQGPLLLAVLDGPDESELVGILARAND